LMLAEAAPQNFLLPAVPTSSPSSLSIFIQMLPSHSHLPGCPHPKLPYPSPHHRFTNIIPPLSILLPCLIFSPYQHLRVKYFTYLFLICFPSVECELHEDRNSCLFFELLFFNA
jgi:hypothetical protein